MSDEQPVQIPPVKRPKHFHGEHHGLSCIVHYARNDNDSDIRPLTEHSFQTVQDAAAIRQCQDRPEWRLDLICQNVPTVYDSALHGRHENCYKNFTNVGKFKSVATAGSESTSSANTVPRRSSFRTPAPPQPLYDNDKCIFCEKSVKIKKHVRDVLRQCLTTDAAEQIETSAREREDFRMLANIRLKDLLAGEAHYHASCYRDYTRKQHRQDDTFSAASTSTAGDETTEADHYGSVRHKQAAEAAFEHVCKYVDKHILVEGSIVRMTMLRDRYSQHMKDNAPDFYNENYRTHSLKVRILLRYGEKLSFRQPRSGSELVYKSDIDVGAAVEMAFIAHSSEKRMFQNAALSLRQHILSSQTESPELPWPPTADYLQSETNVPPDCVLDFLQTLFTEKLKSEASDKTERLVMSVAEDICAATTHGTWKMRKHLLLGISMHHMTGSAQIVTLLNRYGHCCSYQQILELEMAMAAQTICRDSVLPYNISIEGNIIANLCWDNFDLNEETVHGSNTTQSTPGILIQELQSDNLSQVEEMYLPRGRQASTRYIPPVLPPFLNKKRSEPLLAELSTSSTIVDDGPTKPVISTEQLWALCRALHNSSYTVPDWPGWVSVTAAQEGPAIQSVHETAAISDHSA